MSTREEVGGSRTDDRDRPRWHFMPPWGWMNEPHGILHFGGRHHLFYQRNDQGPYWADITWGHAVSDNLVDWTDLGSALTPGAIGYSPDGVWSGSSAIDSDGRPVLFFTAGDNRDNPNQRVGLATAADPGDPELRDWTPHPGPVARLRDAGEVLGARGATLLPAEFRDPFVWQEGGHWFMLVGAGVAGVGGTALVFTAPAPDGPWRFGRPLLVGDHARLPDTGVMWELPSLLPIGVGADGEPRHLFLASPWWLGESEHWLQYQWYWTGRWDADTVTFAPDSEEPRSLDPGGFLTGATPSRMPDGRLLLWSITQDLLSDEEHRRRGWAGSAGVPLQATLGADGTLRAQPVAELEVLRSGPLPVVADTESVCFDHGPMWELATELILPLGGRCAIAVRQSETGSPAALLTVTRPEETRIRIEVRGPAERGTRSAAVAHPPAEPVRLRVLADYSVIEAFIEGVPVTTRAWSTGSELCRIEVTEGGRIDSMTGWTLRAAVMIESRNGSRPSPA